MEVRELKEDMYRRFEELTELILAEGERTRRHFTARVAHHEPRFSQRDRED